MMSVVNYRPLSIAELPKLVQIRARYVTDTVLAVRRIGSFPHFGWQLEEVPIDPPYDKGDLYNFSPDTQAFIQSRMDRPDEAYTLVAESDDKFVGMLDMELQSWNNTAFIWNLMIDQAYRRQGIGKHFWQLAVAQANRWQVRAITLETQHTNVAACYFYQHMGCELIGLNEMLYGNPPSISEPIRRNPEVALFWAYSLL
ncbi:MAG: hypothetical protein OHK0023_04300 [Anaerolineae bacterium]